MNRSASVFAAVVLGLLLTAGGCVAVVPRAKYKALRRELDDARQRNRTLTETNEALQTDIVAKRKQIDSLAALGGKRLEKMFHTARIELGRHTGGVDTDGRAGHDGIKVYLRPIDQHGSTVKAAGDVTVRLFDLAADPKDNLIGRYEWSVDDIAKQWSSGFLTYHYSFVCPWQPGPPKNDEITIRVEFTDYLTGRQFTAQKVCKVNLPVPKAGENSRAKGE
ncbi:MAG: hypothetical protein SVT52_02930 [Planctomycetota bacterium]|nr:hypothetical protein [Planctomycetota bacterium]